MRFFRRIAGFLGLVKDESHEVKDEESDDADVNRVDTHLPRKGFSVPVQVAVERAQVRPVLVPCTGGDGGVQGFRWYTRRLRIDEDGDVADEFFNEVLPENQTLAAGTTKEHHRPVPKFEVKNSTLPAKVRNQALSRDGKFQVRVEHQGRLHWV